MEFNRSVRIMRIACPLVMVAAFVVGYCAWRNGQHFLFGVNMFLAGINVVLTWVQWRVFQLRS